MNTSRAPFALGWRAHTGVAVAGTPETLSSSICRPITRRQIASMILVGGVKLPRPLSRRIAERSIAIRIRPATAKER